MLKKSNKPSSKSSKPLPNKVDRKKELDDFGKKRVISSRLCKFLGKPSRSELTGFECMMLVTNYISNQELCNQREATQYART